MLKSTSSCLHYSLYGVVDFKTLTWSINEATVIACLYEKSRNKNVSPPVDNKKINKHKNTRTNDILIYEIM